MASLEREIGKLLKEKGHKIAESRNVGPSKEHFNPRKRKGNPTKSGEIAGKWHKPKLG